MFLGRVHVRTYGLCSQPGHANVMEDGQYMHVEEVSNVLY